MNPPRWVTRETVLSLHERLLLEFGGDSGIRDPGMLDSALARPENRFAYKNRPSVAELASSYAFGLIKNHPFVDGNKRIGFVVAALFLQLNGKPLQAAEAVAVIQTLALAAGELDEACYVTWLAAYCGEAPMHRSGK